MLKQSEVLTLDDNKQYCVVLSTLIDDINYVYLIDQDDYTNSMFCKFNSKDELEEVDDERIIEKLLRAVNDYLIENIT